MTVDRSYIAENEASLHRLRTFVDGIDDEQLAASMDAGWTVASVLAHMAFWDYRIVVMLERWGPDGDGTPPTYEEDDWINDTTKPIFLAIPPRVAATITLDAAAAADRAVAEMSDDLLVRNDAMGLIINPSRAEHRGEHLDELERTMSA